MFTNRTLLPIIAFCAVIINGVTANADNPVQTLCETYQAKCEQASNEEKCNIWQNNPFQAELGEFEHNGLNWDKAEQRAFFRKTINCKTKDVNSSTCKEIGEACLAFAGTYEKP